MKKYGSYINGETVMGAESIPIINPANGETIGEIAGAGKEQVDAAVEAAREAFKSFKNTTRIERANILRKMADRMEENIDLLAEAETLDTGKTIGEAHLHMKFSLDTYRYFAAAIESREETLVCHDSGNFSAVVREPLGVAGLIVAWNCPPMLLSWKLAPALAMGNTVVIKPSASACMGIMESVKIWEDLFPAGVVNVVNGKSSTIGDYMLSHEGINKLSFTGSVEVGREIGAAGGKRIIPVTLELGGKSASVIFEDANLDRALQMTLNGILSSAGEVCVANSRVLVQESVYDKFLGMLKEKFESVKVGDPMDPKSQMGPLTNEAQMNKVLDYIEKGKSEGATLICGGNRLTENGLGSGYFVKPTIFGDVTPDMTIAQEEIFGPVLCVMKFKDEDDALKQANSTDYGLGAAVWTKDIYRAIRFSKELEAGTVWVNDYLDSSFGNPFGGYKNSGIGREVNKMALEHYSQVKNICVASSDGVPPIW